MIICRLLVGYMCGQRSCIGSLRFLMVSSPARARARLFAPSPFFSRMLSETRSEEQPPRRVLTDDRSTFFLPLLSTACALLRYVTRFPCDIFGFYVAWVYIQYGVQVIVRQFSQTDEASSFLGIILALIMLVLPHIFNLVYKSSFSHRHLRRLSTDYGMPIALIATSGLAYWGRFDKYVLEQGMTLPTGTAFHPANGREWLVQWWSLPGKYVGIAFPFGVVLFILFYFDANVSVSADVFLSFIFFWGK